MAKNHTIIGLDIGTSNITTVVSQLRPGFNLPQIIAVGEARSQGIRRGVVVDIGDAISSIKQSLEEAERISGIKINRAYINIGGSHILSLSSKGVVAVSRANGEISYEDVERVINAAQAISFPPNREIIHVVPREFVVDNEGGIKNVVGMNGIRLEVDTLIVHAASPFLRNLTKVLEELEIEVSGLVLSSLAAARAVLSKRQKELGVLVLDIGGGTTGMSVFEEGDLIHARVFPVGGSHVTNDIAIGLKTGVDTAEQVKLNFGACLAQEVNKRGVIDLSTISEESGSVYRREIADIIEARLVELMGLVKKELKDISKDRLLPSGVVIVGGGAKMPQIVDLVKRELGLPAQLGFPQDVEGIIDKIDDPSLATAIGLVLWGYDVEKKGGDENLILPFPVTDSLNKIKRWVRTFLP